MQREDGGGWNSRIGNDDLYDALWELLQLPLRSDNADKSRLELSGRDSVGKGREVGEEEGKGHGTTGTSTRGPQPLM